MRVEISTSGNEVKMFIFRADALTMGLKNFSPIVTNGNILGLIRGKSIKLKKNPFVTICEYFFRISIQL